MDDKKKTRPRIYLGRTGKAESYTSTANRGPKPPAIPLRNRQQHGGALMAQLRTVSDQQERLSQEAATCGLESSIGIQVEFESFPGIELAVQSLADAPSRIELMNVRQSEQSLCATIFVPEGKLTVIEAKLHAYLEKKKDKNGKARDNRALIDAIATFRVAAIDGRCLHRKDRCSRGSVYALGSCRWVVALEHDIRHMG